MILSDYAQATAQPANNVRTLYGVYAQRYRLQERYLQRVGDVLERTNLRGNNVLVVRVGELELYLFKDEKGACDSGKRD